MAKYTGLQHTATALVGALILSTAFVAAAVGPAAAVEHSPTVASVQTPLTVQASV